ncbi:Uncharacterized protein APZ42_031124 [Daphnia magna]|uniref:Uncharacterized protein n=1 Tax=Daphnia magna TaxID=35525 RepID=A0A164N4F2_9CRUS|nr:Uncharacterized protein APZ42_031124 [Daphnia magna]
MAYCSQQLHCLRSKTFKRPFPFAALKPQLLDTVLNSSTDCVSTLLRYCSLLQLSNNHYYSVFLTAVLTVFLQY